MLDKLKKIEERCQEVETELSDPSVFNDMKKYADLNREYKGLQKIIKAGNEFRLIVEGIASSKQMIKEESDPEMIEMAKMELDELEGKKEPTEAKLKLLMVPKEPEDAKNAIVEIRAGAGGDEASIFAGDLYRMYSKFVESHGWKVEIMDVSDGTSGGYKEIIFKIEGEDAYGTLKFEAGVHRVQRVPQTETQGRVHTSAATVMVLPEAEEFDVELVDAEIKYENFCSSGPGGQSVNTTYSAVRLTHIPTGIVAQCQDQKSKLKNHEKALKVLRSRLYEKQLKEKMEADASKRKLMVSSSDRSAKIRTYNYPQSRLTDHRINLTLYSLDNVMDGDIQEIIEALTLADSAERLSEGGVFAS